MPGPFVIFLIEFAAGVTPALVLLASARRLFLSRSVRAVPYGLTALLAAAGTAGGGILPDPVATGAALAALPVWLLIRAAFPRTAPAYADPVLRPVFASVRAAAARGELHRRPVVAT